MRSQLATDSAAPVESVVDRLEDAVAMVNPDGQVVFANAAIRAALPEAAAGSKLTAWPQLHPYREVVERALATRQSVGPLRGGVTRVGRRRGRRDRAAADGATPCCTPTSASWA